MDSILHAPHWATPNYGQHRLDIVALLSTSFAIITPYIGPICTSPDFCVDLTNSRLVQSVTKLSVASIFKHRLAHKNLLQGAQ